MEPDLWSAASNKCTYVPDRRSNRMGRDINKSALWVEFELISNLNGRHNCRVTWM
jgi:hypothetical protein